MFCAPCATLLAHDPGLSAAEISVGEREITALLTFNESDVGSLIGQSVAEIRGGQAREKLNAVAGRALSLAEGGQPLVPHSSSARPEGENNVEFRVVFERGPQATEFVFASALLSEMPFGHRQSFVARDGAGGEITRRILSNKENSATFSAGQTASASVSNLGVLFEFLKLGLHHIITGYDHLLFLLGLLVVCRDLRSAVVLITCFTVAHSLTLALSAFNLVNFQSRYVEAIIAASIVYVGLENLLRRQERLRNRWRLTFLFGLVHGLGFAGILRELGVAERGASAVVVPLLGFNSGVELGQLAIAAVVLPLIWKLQQSPSFLRYGVPACSLIVVLAGGYWLVERTLFS